MKLEPGRTSLSGRPEFLRSVVPVQTSAPKLVQRKCCMCATPDVVQLIDDAPDHSVAIELRFLTAPNEEVAKQQVAKKAAKGWRYKFHLGRFAMERDICRGCLIAHQEMEQEFKRKRTNELKSSMQSDSYYMALCGD